MADALFGTVRLELFDQHHWELRRKLVLATFEWIEARYKPHRRRYEAAQAA